MTRNKTGLRLALTVPRFETGHAGGAEIHAKVLAQKLQSAGYSIEILTTCARNHHTWENVHPPGECEIDGLHVRRFLTNTARDIEKFLEIQEKITGFEEIPFDLEKAWINESVTSEGLFSYLEEHRNDYDIFLFIPYLFGTTYWGAQIVQKKAVLIPCLHDEPYARLKIFQELIDNVKGIIPSTDPEIALIKRLYDTPDYKISRVGMGFTPAPEYNPGLFRKKYHLIKPFIYYAGRREDGKNTGLLIEMMREYQNNNGNAPALVLSGSGEVKLEPQDSGRIIDLGFLPEEDMQNAYSASLAFCTPSLNESLSIVLMESWLAGRPAIVHDACEVTKDHCIKSNGGLYFRNFEEFAEILDFLTANPAVADAMGKNGRIYVEREFNWSAVISRFNSAIKKFGFMN